MTEVNALMKTHICVYPIYIDSEITQDEGRKIAKDKSIQNPNLKAMFIAAKNLGFDVILQENKRHPRDFWRFGRLYVKFFDDSHNALHPTIKKKRQLLEELVVEMNKIGNIEPEGGAGSDSKRKMTSEERAKNKRAQKKK